jgi:DNA-directed RNA polymerase specialized sigma subunit
MAAKREDQGKLTAKPGPQEQLASEERLWARFAERRDAATREELVRRYLPLARSLTQR